MTNALLSATRMVTLYFLLPKGALITLTLLSLESMVGREGGGFHLI